jgi:RimJ/RimL family protein N-acetyltransferase
MLIRRLTLADAEQYRAFRLWGLQAYPSAFRSSHDEEAAKPLSFIEQRIGDGSPRAARAAWGAFDGASGRQIGAIAYERETRVKLAHRASVLGMLVAEGCTGQGLGQRLLETLVDHAKSQPGLEWLYLTVTASNARAIALYERCGFVRDCVEHAAMKCDGQLLDKQHMLRDLR